MLLQSETKVEPDPRLLGTRAFSTCAAGIFSLTHVRPEANRNRKPRKKGRGKRRDTTQPRTQASSRYPSYKRRLGTERDRRIFKLDRWRHIRNHRGRLGTRPGATKVWTTGGKALQFTSAWKFSSLLFPRPNWLPWVSEDGLKEITTKQNQKMPFVVLFYILISLLFDVRIRSSWWESVCC